MLAIASLLLVIALSLLFVRVGAIALTMTGVSEDVAKFQALSAFSGAGFTTGEAENVVNGPARRRIIAMLIRAGSAGIVTAITTLMLSFAGDSFSTEAKLATFLFGGAAIIFIARSGSLARLTRPLIERVLKTTPALDLRDYAALLHLRDNWRVAEFQLDTSSPFVGQSLRDLWLRDSQVIVLGIEREDGSWEGVPSLDQPLESGDTLLVYGEGEMLATVLNTANPEQG